MNPQARIPAQAATSSAPQAIVAIARSILVITWHLINEPDTHYQELGADWYQRHLNPTRKTRDLVRQLLGHQVTLEPAA
ncbi:hypothetical protein [Actinomadura chokoriensis]|uniref:IS110 family transposase n=1 Tax=Actinomadura chokoriensis TaxID=454156 RepID=A0ABV4QVD9_9ACTN